LYSVDIATEYYLDKSKAVGYIADAHYIEGTHPRWHKLPGKDISDCIATIGAGIDFAILDTSHSLPGELLSFFALLPFLTEKAELILHDISLPILYRRNDPDRTKDHPLRGACTPLLFYALWSDKKYCSDAEVPNCGAVTIDKETVLQNAVHLVNMLHLNWNSLPPPRVLMQTQAIVEQYYPKTVVALYKEAVAYNLWIRGVRIEQH
ncbi:class I SAM-dependent methyltransferase, partial [Desulfovibrio sp. OttesenSCG-928-A18]|nr:class I SAM-dependent methyltransferase [Desulfovibrio sp. OttesenSCG-928-A18]